nr:GSU2403 family nucleotidyltransferase fold protein [Rhizobium sp. AQ_MP]
MSGDIVEALAEVGLFRLRGVLIGTVAFQCYSGLLGMRLPMAAILTGDADFAQDYAISQEVADSLPPIVELLQGVDPSFRPVPIDQDLLLRPRSKTPGGDTGLSS